MKNIIMVSGKATSGKTTFANFLIDAISENNNYKVGHINFADKLKEITTDIFNWSGKKDTNGRQLLIDIGQIARGNFGIEKFNYIKFDRRDELMEIWNKFTKFYFPNINFWSNIVINKILSDKDENKIYIISDWRFKSEYYNMKLYFNDIMTMRIYRNGINLIDDISEKDLDDFDFKIKIDNTSDLETFKNNAKYIINHFYR